MEAVLETLREIFPPVLGDPVANFLGIGFLLLALVSLVLFTLFFALQLWDYTHPDDDDDDIFPDGNYR